jgi:lipopolysaccharide transport system permease protein
MSVSQAESSQPLSVPDQRSSDDMILIEPMRGWVPINVRELWQYRELLVFFIWRDLKVRYKQTILGIVWVILQPVMTMIVMSVVFGKMAGIPTDGIPYPIFAYSALLPWTFFAGGLSRASGSLVGSVSLVQKIYFPRLILPIAAVVDGIVDFLLAFIVLVGMMVYYNIYPTLSMVWLLIPLLILSTLAALGIGLWMAAVNVRYRDIRYIVPFMTQFWMYITPVVYPSSLVGHSWKTVYSLNPMVGVINGFRWVLLNRGGAPGITIWISVVVSIVTVITGAMYFRRMEKTFADVI